MIELKNPDWTKSFEEREKIKRVGSWELWWSVEHQYPYQLPLKPSRRVWVNPFYLLYFTVFWINCVEETSNGE